MNAKGSLFEMVWEVAGGRFQVTGYQLPVCGYKSRMYSILQHPHISTFLTFSH